MLQHVKYPVNTNGRDFVVGDVHGYFNLLMAKLAEVEFDTMRDRLFAVGDLIDRGPQSMDCLRLIDKPWFHTVLGNHEDMMVNAIANVADYGVWTMNGGGWYRDEPELEVRAMADVLQNDVPIAITVETPTGPVGICHAQPPLTYNWADAINTTKHRDSMLWGRSDINRGNTTPVIGVRMTIHGHSPIPQPIQLANKLYIDTGACFGGVLTIIQINCEEAVHDHCTNDSGATPHS